MFDPPEENRKDGYTEGGQLLQDGFDPLHILALFKVDPCCGVPELPGQFFGKLQKMLHCAGFEADVQDMDKIDGKQVVNGISPAHLGHIDKEQLGALLHDVIGVQISVDHGIPFRDGTDQPVKQLHLLRGIVFCSSVRDGMIEFGDPWNLRIRNVCTVQRQHQLGVFRSKLRKGRGIGHQKPGQGIGIYTLENDTVILSAFYHVIGDGGGYPGQKCPAGVFPFPLNVFHIGPVYVNLNDLVAGKVIDHAVPALGNDAAAGDVHRPERSLRGDQLLKPGGLQDLIDFG